MLADDITMVICPGIGNHSETHYIRTFVDYSQKQGYRCAVLNHLGALPNIELTSPRMFTYGKSTVGVIKYLHGKQLFGKLLYLCHHYIGGQAFYFVWVSGYLINAILQSKIFVEVMM